MARAQTSDRDGDSPVISMPITFDNTRSCKIAAILLLTIACSSMAKASEKMRWEDLPKRIRKQTNRDFVVLTKNGGRFRGRFIQFAPSGLAVFDNRHSESISREKVARILIGQNGRYSSQMMDEFDEVVIILFPPYAVYVGIRAAILLPLEGVARLVPAKVIEIIQ